MHGDEEVFCGVAFDCGEADVGDGLEFEGGGGLVVGGHARAVVG